MEDPNIAEICKRNAKIIDLQRLQFLYALHYSSHAINDALEDQIEILRTQLVPRMTSRTSLRDPPGNACERKIRSDIRAVVGGQSCNAKKKRPLLVLGGCLSMAVSEGEQQNRKCGGADDDNPKHFVYSALVEKKMKYSAQNLLQSPTRRGTRAERNRHLPRSRRTRSQMSD